MAMTKQEIKEKAKKIVSHMLNGRCLPETEDVEEYTQDENEQELLINEINKILERLDVFLETKL